MSADVHSYLEINPASVEPGVPAKLMHPNAGVKMGDKYGTGQRIRKRVDKLSAELTVYLHDGHHTVMSVLVHVKTKYFPGCAPTGAI